MHTLHVVHTMQYTVPDPPEFSMKSSIRIVNVVYRGIFPALVLPAFFSASFTALSEKGAIQPTATSEKQRRGAVAKWHGKEPKA